MDELQIYDDLIQLDITKYQERIDELEHQVNKLNADIQKLCTKMLEMKECQASLVKNISALYATAKNEIQRKDRMIAELRKEKDDILFRRVNFSHNKRPHSRSRSTSRENKKGKYMGSNELVTEVFSKEKLQIIKQSTARISEDKDKSKPSLGIVKNIPNKQIKTSPRSSHKSTPRSSKEKDLEHKTRKDSKSKDIIKDNRSHKTSSKSIETSNNLQGHIKYKNIYTKHNQKSPKHHRRETDSSHTSKSSNNKQSARDLKSVDLRDKLPSHSKYKKEIFPNNSKRYKNDLSKERSDSSDKDSLKSKEKEIIAQNETKLNQDIIKTEHVKKILGKHDDEIEEGEIMEESFSIEIIANKLEKPAKEVTETQKSSDKNCDSKNAISSEISDLKLNDETVESLKPSKFISDIIKDAEMSCIREDIAEANDDIIEFHIQDDFDESLNKDLLLAQVEGNATLEGMTEVSNPRENDNRCSDSVINELHQNNENVNFSNNINNIQTEEKTEEMLRNSSLNSSRRRRRAIVFIS